MYTWLIALSFLCLIGCSSHLSDHRRISHSELPDTLTDHRRISHSELPDTLTDRRRISRSELLDTLKGRLDIVRAALPEQHMEFEPDLDIAILIGMKKDSVKLALGSPRWCQDNNYQSPKNCDSTRRWLYDFHHFPRGWVEGGTEIVLLFDSSDRVENSYWVRLK